MNHTIKISIIALLSLCTLQAHHTTPLPKVRFENAILKLVDGVPFCMDGDNVKKMVIVTAIFKHMLYGTDPKTKAYNPRYSFNNQPASIAELTMKEQSDLSPEQQQALQEKLHDVIIDFYEQVHPFLEDAKKALEYNLPLIEEWMEKTKRMDTELYGVHNCDEDQEFAHIQSRMTNFEKLSTLLEDLISYFESFIHSCPKGVAQFKEIMKRRHAHT